MPKKKVLITVKTYPSLSKKYGELVCTAGIDDSGNWIRLYPIPYRKLYRNDSQYEKYRWIEVEVNKSRKDHRPESYKVDYRNIKILNNISHKDWRGRKEIVLKRGVHFDMANLIQISKDTNLSLATFKPSKVIDFVWEAVDRDYPEATLRAIEDERKQSILFEDDIDNSPDFKEVRKLPYRFSYVFIDENNKRSKLMVEDWEVGAAFWGFLKTYKSEEEALKMMKDKFFTTLVNKTDLHFFMGTTRQYHGWAQNPFIIIGLFYPPKQNQFEFNF